MNALLTLLYLLLCVGIVIFVPPLVAPYTAEYGLVTSIDAAKAVLLCTALAALVATVLHTPGHTEGSICLFFPAEKKLIAGDTLFAGSIGRTDLPGGSMEKILRSLKGKLLELPDETLVVPGHGSLTTIGDERESNPYLQG